MNEPKQTPTRLDVETAEGTAHYKLLDLAPMDGAAGLVVTITGYTGSDWLAMGEYPARLIDGDTRNPGSLAVYDCQSSIEGIKFVGIWRQAQP
jgi:hypothetical protein